MFIRNDDYWQTILKRNVYKFNVYPDIFQLCVCCLSGALKAFTVRIKMIPGKVLWLLIKLLKQQKFLLQTKAIYSTISGFWYTAVVQWIYNL